jgi:hypothetical protein
MLGLRLDIYIEDTIAKFQACMIMLKVVVKVQSRHNTQKQYSAKRPTLAPAAASTRPFMLKPFCQMLDIYVYNTF